MLTTETLEAILARLPGLTIGVVGDLFLDRYLELDASLTESSLETGLAAYQVVAVRSSPGAAGTVINNLAALGVGRIVPIAFVGDDGEGYELLQALDRLPGLDRRWLIQDRRRRTPTYTKPMLHETGRAPRELNRLDIKNRTPLPLDMQGRLSHALTKVWPTLDALLVLDQVSEANCGVVTVRMRLHVGRLAYTNPEKFVLADSRECIGHFFSVCVKPNERECLAAANSLSEASIENAAADLARCMGRAVFCTRGEAGILLVEPNAANSQVQLIPAYPVHGPIDIVGAGDSTSAGIAAAVAAGARLDEAAAFGNLVASITIQQLGTTGTASPEQVRQRWQQQGAATRA